MKEHKWNTAQILLATQQTNSYGIKIKQTQPAKSMHTNINTNLYTYENTINMYYKYIFLIYSLK